MHGHIQGSYVVFDPTGRDMPSCMRVGRVISCQWDTDADYGNADGSPRPLLYVVPNGEDDPVACTTITAVLWAPDDPESDEAPHAITQARTPVDIITAATVVLRFDPPIDAGALDRSLYHYARDHHADYELHQLNND